MREKDYLTPYQFKWNKMARKLEVKLNKAADCTAVVLFADRVSEQEDTELGNQAKT